LSERPAAVTRHRRSLSREDATGRASGRSPLPKAATLR
jgi:hypothetical protein